MTTLPVNWKIDTLLYAQGVHLIAHYTCHTSNYISTLLRFRKPHPNREKIIRIFFIIYIYKKKTKINFKVDYFIRLKKVPNFLLFFSFFLNMFFFFTKIWSLFSVIFISIENGSSLLNTHHYRLKNESCIKTKITHIIWILKLHRIF